MQPLINFALTLRHVSLSLQFPELTVWYWGSFTQQRGFELSLGGGFLETTYRLTLKQYSDGLLRRPAADWSATKLRSEVSNVTCHLYGLEEVDGKEEIGDEYAEVETLSVVFMKEYIHTLMLPPQKWNGTLGAESDCLAVKQ